MRAIALVVLSIGVFSSLGQEASARPASQQRILYVGDWSGSDEIYSVDPAHPASVAQITFGHPPGCDPLKDVPPICAIRAVAPSPDGRRIAYVISDPSQHYCSGLLFVADADGRVLHQLAPVKSCGPGVAWAADSRRLAYEPASDAGTPAAAVYVVDVARPRQRRYAGFATGGFAWSPNGRYVATDSGYTRVDGVRGHRTYPAVNAFAWSPNGRWLALVDSHGLALVNAATGNERPLPVRDADGALSWSSDSRFIAYDSYNASSGQALSVLELATGTSRRVSGETYQTYGARGWSGAGELLAFDGEQGLSLFDASAGTTRAISADHASWLVWASDGRSIAYIAASPYARETAALRTVTLDGQIRTVIPGSGFAGGNLGSITWTRPPATIHYRRAVPRMAATVLSATSVVARWPIDVLAADGPRVAYASCGHVFVWTPGTGSVVQIEPAATLIPFCSFNYWIQTSQIHTVFDLALGGDRVAFGTQKRDEPYRAAFARTNVLRLGWNLWEASISAPGDLQRVDEGSGSNFCTNGQRLGDLVASGDLIAFSRWVYTGDPDHCTGQGTPEIATQTVLRVDPPGCPCAAIASSPGLLRPADVEGDRIVAFGNNQTLVLDSAGNQLLAVPVSPLAAQLAGNDLVLALQGELRSYDATTGTLEHSWPIPNVTTGGECGGQYDDRCRVRLVLEDAARGLVAYVLDGQVHVLRLSDGADATVAAGTLARFMDAGLVYASNADLHIVPWSQLPLR